MIEFKEDEEFQEKSISIFILLKVHHFREKF